MLSLPLKDVVQKEDLCVHDTASIRDAIRLMNRNQRGVVVVLKDDKPSGIITERDIVDIVYKKNNLDENVDKYAVKNLVSTTGDRTIGYALNLTLDNNIRRVVVTDNARNFLGVVTQQELLRYLEEDYYRSIIKVKHIVKNSGSLISVTGDDSLNCVIKKMVENKISAVPVMNDKRAVGIITEKDILRLACNNVSLESKAGMLMSSPIDTASLDTALVEIVEVMNYKNIRRIVVVNDEEQAVNIITLRDVVRNLEGDYSQFLERKLKNAKEILNLLPEMLVEITDTGKEQLIVWANEKVISHFGTEIIDTPVTHFLSRESWDKIYATLKTLNRIENIKIKKDNRIYELSGFFMTTYGDEDRGKVQLIMRDITEDIMLSTLDALTNVYNRRVVNEFLVKELARSRRSEYHFSVVICDIDNFKKINDTYGHLSGDAVLKSVSRLMKGSIRHFDVVGRYGGDEFMIILPETGNETASQIVERIRRNIEDVDILLLNDVPEKITASFGIATYPEDGNLLEDLLIIADERLYKAKGLGKNKIICT